MMEVTPHLKTVLKNYQHSATKSLQGPGLSLIPSKCESPVEDTDKDESDYIQPQPFPIQQLPILTSADKTCSERSETCLEGEAISCFVVGGEKRLCLPQVLNSVLREFTLQQINHECDNLQIYCSRCTPEQLNVLKTHSILPSSAPSCGLITKTDAERLCSALLHRSELGPALRPKKSALNFMVYHECFGKCRGVCVPEMYAGKNSRCIECIDCQGWFAPQQFVCHVHRDLENRTVHWGFDSCNWRSYVLIAEDQIEHEQYNKYLDEMKEQYDGKTPFPQPEWSVANLKRKLVHPDAEIMIKQEVVDIPLKKNKLDEYNLPLPYNLQQLYALDPLYFQYFHEQCIPTHRPMSAFKPFGHSLKETKLKQSIALANRPISDPPPTLVNPERVVPTSQTEQYEQSYQPNVALAPPTSKKQRLMRAAEPMQEVTSSIQKETPISPTIIKIEIEKADSDKMQKSPDSQNIIDSTVSVVQSTGNLTRYNSEIELSTDTDDTASISSEKHQSTEIGKIEETLKTADMDTRDAVLKIVRHMAKDHEAALQDSRDKDNRIRELEAKLAELQTRIGGMVNGVCDTHNGPEATTPDRLKTPSPPPQRTETPKPSATSPSPTNDSSPETCRSDSPEHPKSVITALETE